MAVGRRHRSAAHGHGGRLQGDTRLLVIGFGFNDRHINSTILKAAEGGMLKMFIVDPLGVDAAVLMLIAPR
jgi:hypothetical protein